MPQKGSKALILDFFLANMGRVIESKELQMASGDASEWARRTRELRDEQGYQILTHKDRAHLKPGQYLLDTDKRRPAFSRGISKETLRVGAGAQWLYLSNVRAWSRRRGSLQPR